MIETFNSMLSLTAPVRFSILLEFVKSIDFCVDYLAPTSSASFR